MSNLCLKNSVEMPGKVLMSKNVAKDVLKGSACEIAFCQNMQDLHRLLIASLLLIGLSLLTGGLKLKVFEVICNYVNCYRRKACKASNHYSINVNLKFSKP